MREKEKWYKFVTTNWKIKELSKHFAKVKLFEKCFVWHHFYTHKKKKNKCAREQRALVFYESERKTTVCDENVVVCRFIVLFSSNNHFNLTVYVCLCFFFRRKCLPLKIITKRKEFSFTWLNIKRIEASHVYQKV